MPLEANTTILGGKYRILRLIGEGSFAHVWLAEETAFGARQVAIKELRRDRLTSSELEEQEKRFGQEIGLAALLGQAGVPNVVHALTLERLDDGTRLLVMEYADGGSLDALIRAHPQGLPVKQAVTLARQIGKALDGFHHLVVTPVHRDIKPSNILLNQRGEALLSDFGLAQLPGSSDRSGGAAAHPGTPIYMSPEQARSPEVLRPAADIYALGCVLFEMLTGTRYKTLKPGTKAGTLRKGVPAALERMLARALHEDQYARYTTAAEMAADLERVLLGLHDGGGPAWPMRGNWPRLALPSGALAVIVLVILDIIWWHVPAAIFDAAQTPTATVVVKAPSSATPTPPVTATAKPATTAPASATPTPQVTATPRPLAAAPASATLAPTNEAPTTVVPTTVMLATTIPTTAVPANTAPPPNPGNLLPAPVVNSPPDDETIESPASPTLQWAPVKSTLAANEVYLITIYFKSKEKGEIWTDYAWTSDAAWSAQPHDWLLDTADTGTPIRWTVKLIRQTGTDKNGVPQGSDLSAASEERRFTWRRPTNGGGGGGGSPCTGPYC